VNARRTNSTACHHKVVSVAHAPNGFDDVALLIGNDLDAFKLDAQREAVFGKVGRIGINSLW
jgi:hypothetical protein